MGDRVARIEDHTEHHGLGRRGERREVGDRVRGIDQRIGRRQCGRKCRFAAAGALRGETRWQYSDEDDGGPNGERAHRPRRGLSVTDFYTERWSSCGEAGRRREP